MIIKSIIVIMLDLIIMILIGDVCVCMCLCGLICSQKYEYLEGYDSKCGIFFSGALNLHYLHMWSDYGISMMCSMMCFILHTNTQIGKYKYSI